MFTLDLIRFSANKINLINNLSIPGKMEIAQQLQHNVKRTENGASCITTVIVEDKTSSSFSIEVAVTADFRLSGGQAEEGEISAECYRQIYPYVRTLITTMTANAGMQPLIIKYTPIDPKNVTSSSLKNYGN